MEAESYCYVIRLKANAVRERHTAHLLKRPVGRPSKKPKAIDLIVIEGDKDGQTILGIYEITEKTRRLCYVSPGLERPTEFTSTAANQQVLVPFEREKAK